MKLQEYIIERDKALLDMNIERIKELSQLINIPVPKNEIVILASMHKCRVNLLNIPKDKFNESVKWLKDNNFTCDIR